MEREQPFFSIVIPTYNRPERLATCLKSLARLDYPRDGFEVIIVDDGSEMPVESSVEPVRSQLHITLLKQPNAGPATARNTGAFRASGEFLAFTDDDCTPAPNWLTTLAARFAKSPDCIIGGRTVNALSDNLYSTASQLLIDYLYGYYNASAEGASFFASNNFALPAERFRALGGFDTSFPLAAAEDREFCDRWLHKGYQMIYAPEVLVCHAHQLTLTAFWRQHFNYGRGALCFHQVRAERNRTPMKVEPFSFYLNLLTYPFVRSSQQPAPLLTGLFFLSQVANAAGFFWERRIQQRHS